MLFHYCDKMTGEDIAREGVIRANPVTLHADMLGRDEGFDTPPVVWLTVSDTVDMTVYYKLIAAGWNLNPGDIVRVVFHDEYPCEPLDVWSDRVNISADTWKWNIATAQMVGSSWTDWRIVDHDIQAADWLRIEPVE